VTGTPPRPDSPEYQRGRAAWVAGHLAATFQNEDTAADPYPGAHDIVVPRLAPADDFHVPHRSTP
jgi:hypothetical protein